MTCKSYEQKDTSFIHFIYIWSLWPNTERESSLTRCIKDCIFTLKGCVMTSDVSLLKPTERRIMYTLLLNHYPIPHHRDWWIVWRGSPQDFSGRSSQNLNSTTGKEDYGPQAILSLPAVAHRLMLSKSISKISRFVLIATPWREVVLRTSLIKC